MKRTLTAAAIAVLAVVAGVAGYLVARHHSTQSAAVPAVTQPAPAQAQAPVVQSEGVVGEMRPDFTLPDVAGIAHNVSEWDGKVLVINFWATWCPPCRKEIPEFVALQKKYGDQGLQFVGIALQRPEEVRGFMEEHGMNYPVLAGELEVIRVAKSYGNAVGALPYTAIVDRTGHVAFLKAGPLPGEAAETVILPLL